MIAKRNFPIPAFLFSLAAVYCVAFYFAARLPSLEYPHILAAAVTFDLTLFVPLLYYLLLVRGKNFPAFTVVPVFLASLLAASYIVPETYNTALNLLGWLVAAIEITAAGFIARKIYRFKKHFAQAKAKADSDIFELLQTATQQTLGASFTARAAAFEISVLYFAVVSWRKKVEIDSKTTFSYHNNLGYGAIVFGFVLLLAAETLVLHALVEQWSAAAAWVLTALSIYGALWLIGDYRALKLRPVRILDDAIDLRLGLRWNVSISFAAIESFGQISTETFGTQDSNYLKAVMMDEPNYFLRFKDSQTIQGIYGTQRKVRLIGFAIDESAKFGEALHSAIETWKRNSQMNAE